MQVVERPEWYLKSISVYIMYPSKGLRSWHMYHALIMQLVPFHSSMHNGRILKVNIDIEPPWVIPVR